MAYYQPSEAEIQNFLSFVPGIDRREIIARIKGNNNNVEYAINEYYEDYGDPSNKYRWVDGQFSTDRDGEYMHDSTPSFNIHAADDTGPYEVREPQTRPPSRTTNNRSPMTNVIDLTVDHANADPRTSVTHDDDTELQRAIEESRVSAGLLPQETGITSTDRVTFGPATRSQYEEKEWGMVTVGKTSAQEILLDPEPAARKRDLNVPAFLRPSVADNRLGALLTIYHEIPLLREVFMNRSDVQPSYGFDSEWWTGKAIEVPTTLGSEPDEGQELIYEIQRLMAFLDKTDRSYGSADVLANLRAVKKMQRFNTQKRISNADLEVVVLQAWKRVFDTRETGQVSKLFSVGVDSEQKTEITEFVILDLPLPARGSGVETFYDIADEILWGNVPQTDSDIASCAYLEHIADVVTFRLNEDQSPGGNIDIPLVWYPDRYLKSARQAALDMRLQKTEVNEELRRITALQDGLTEVCARGKMVKVQKLLKAALQHDLDNLDGENNTDPDHTYISEEEAISKRSSEKSAKLSAELGKIVASIDRKLLALNSEKEKARDILRQLSKLYTEASADPTEPPSHKYTLRGVSTTKNTMYIRRKAEIDLIDMGLDNDGSPPNGDQWWRIDYSSGSNPVIVEKVTEEKVLEAAKTESKNFLLVYASEKAMQFESKPLPHPLETFVRNDNELFQAELAADDAQSQESHVTSPGKRKFNAQSDNSEEYNRWNGGTSPKGYENSTQVMERELRSTDGASDLDDIRVASQQFANRMDESRTVTPGIDEHEVIHGVDPTLLDHDDTPFSGQEMQERSGMLMLSSRGGGEPTTIDSMDLDQVVEDENSTEESAAVKNVELA